MECPLEPERKHQQSGITYQTVQRDVSELRGTRLSSQWQQAALEQSPANTTDGFEPSLPPSLDSSNSHMYNLVEVAVAL